MTTQAFENRALVQLPADVRIDYPIHSNGGFVADFRVIRKLSFKVDKRKHWESARPGQIGRQHDGANLVRRHIDPNWEIAAPDVKAMIDANEAVMLLDVRQPEETEISLIAGSEVCPLPGLHQHVESIRDSAAGRLIVTICHHGHRSVQAAALLREAGIGRVLSLAGGIDAWSVQVDPAIARY